MSVRTAVIILAVILLLLGVSRLLGRLAEERVRSTSYLEETARTTKELKRMKEEKGERMRKQEKSILDEE